MSSIYLVEFSGADFGTIPVYAESEAEAIGKAQAINKAKQRNPTGKPRAEKYKSTQTAGNCLIGCLVVGNLASAALLYLTLYS
jgi:hypothetical protein